ncbi:hypothetical protein [Caenimonas sp. SL110]|uniref:hypothetical protein n=1 Tax=Caenimonas sp. SL110 TaxID=1450524 RepID=UPI00128D4197|nr:hypothetical protein [Caenimonas sp. SL110]
MNRCQGNRARHAAASFAALAGLPIAISLSLALPVPSFAQTDAQSAAVPTMQRSVPRDVVLGRMVITAPPEILLNGKPDRLSPGSRIRNVQNMMVLSGGIVNQDLPIVYKRDATGLVHEVWVLTPEEYKKLGGVNTNDPLGVQQFFELLALIFGARR